MKRNVSLTVMFSVMLALVLIGCPMEPDDDNAIPEELIGGWVLKGTTDPVIFEFTSNTLKLNSASDARTAKASGKKIEYGNSGVYVVFCESYTLSGGELSFEGGVYGDEDGDKKYTKK
jgi:hypothetical protein